MTTPIKLNASLDGLAEFAVDDAIPVEDGGTGAITASAALANLGAASALDLSNHTAASNPHNITPALIGAATSTALTSHVGATNPHNITPALIGAATATALTSHTNASNPHNITPTLIGAATPANVSAAVSSHISDTNPHNITPTLIGAAVALDLSNHTAASNPHNITPTLIGAATALDLSNHMSNPSAHGSFVPNSEKGAPNGVCDLDSAGKIPNSRLPAGAIPEIFIVANATERTALVVQSGDEAIQLDDGSQWIFNGTVWHQRPMSTGSGNVSGPSSSADGEIAIFNGLTGKVIKSPNNLINTGAGAINGRDIADDGTKLDTAVLLLAALTPKHCELISTSAQEANAAFTPVPFSVQELLDSSVFNHISGTSNITVLQSGIFEISYQALVVSTSNNRKVAGAEIYLDGTALPRTKSAAYLRNRIDAHGSLSCSTFKKSLTAGSVVQLRVGGLGSAGTAELVPLSTSISLTMVRST